MDDDRPGFEATEPRLRRTVAPRARRTNPLAAAVGVLTVLGLAGCGALLVRASAVDPTPPISDADSRLHRLHRPYRGLPPMTVAVPVAGHRVIAALLDVPADDPGAAVLRVEIDGRARSCRLREGGREAMGGVVVELVSVHSKDRAEEASADVRVSAAAAP